jgi:hypothetical protein
MTIDLLTGVMPFKERIKKFSRDDKPIPERITKKYLEKLVEEEKAVVTPSDYLEASEIISNTDDKLIILPYDLHVNVKESNRIIKKPVAGNFISYNSKRLLENVIHHAEILGYKKNEGDGVKLNIELLERLHLDPELFLRAGIEIHNGKPTPPIGIAWTKDSRKRLTTWTRIANAYSLADMNRHVSINKKFYGNTIRCMAPSDSDPKRAKYSYVIRNLPITKSQDVTMYSKWFDLETNDPDPDGEFRGNIFNKKISNIFWTRNSITGLILSGRKLRDHPLTGKRRMYVNPFIKCNDEGKEYFRKLQNNCIVEGNAKGRIPNRTTMDLLIGARLIIKGYDSYFTSRYKQLQIK